MQICWDNRLIGDVGFKQKITVDGTDFLCHPPNDGSSRRSWYSHKFKKPAVRYELGVSIQSGDIVWVNGPWRAGSYPDISIFRLGGLRDKLLENNERAEADLGYRGEPLAIDLPDEGPKSMILAKKRARMRHETCNKRFKNWGCMKQEFRHGLSLHRDCMYAITVLTQLAIRNGEPLFDAAFYIET